MWKKWNNQTNKTQQYLSKFLTINKHSQYQLNPPYNTMQTTCLIQLNNPPQNGYQYHNIECLQVLKSKK